MEVGEDGIELGDREPSLGSTVRRCCDVRRWSRDGDTRPELDVTCLRSAVMVRLANGEGSQEKGMKTNDFETWLGFK